MDPEREDQEYEQLQGQTKAGELLWHYTDWNALRGIIDLRQVWATHFSHLNDTQEVFHALRLTKDFFSAEMLHIRQQIDRVVAREEKAPPIYIASFSEAFDSLEQWRAYSGASIGFALGFDAKQLLEIAKAYKFDLVHCVYDDQKARDRARQFEDDWQENRERQDRIAADPTLHAGEKHTSRKAYGHSQRVVIGKLVAAMVPFKNECFCSENEVRLISDALVPNGADYRIMHPDVKQDFRLQGTEIINFVKVPLGFPQYHVMATDDPQMKTPLRALMIGPTNRDTSAARDELRRYTVQATGLSIVVAASKRPIRSK